jgi:hypothetical protein
MLYKKKYVDVWGGNGNNDMDRVTVYKHGFYCGEKER